MKSHLKHIRTEMRGRFMYHRKGVEKVKSNEGAPEQRQSADAEETSSAFLDELIERQPEQQGQQGESFASNAEQQRLPHPGAEAIAGNRAPPSSPSSAEQERDSNNDQINEQLPVAAEVVEEEDEDVIFFRRLRQVLGEAVPVADVVLQEGIELSSRRGKLKNLLLIAALATVGVLVAVVVTTTSPSKENTASSNFDTEESEPISGEHGATTPAEPTPDDTNEEDFLPDELVLESLETEFGPDTSLAAQLEGTPQQKAAQWISQQDTIVNFPLDRNSSVTECFRQRFALATLYFSTGGSIDNTTASLWTNEYHFVSPTLHECYWNDRMESSFSVQGVICNESETVAIGLSLNKNGLAGSIPPEIIGLSNLETLNLSKNAIIGNVPPEIASLVKLEVLDFSNMSLTGSFPTALHQLTSLKSLSLDENHLDGSIVTSFENMIALRILSLGGNAFSGNVPLVLPNFVEQLRLADNNFSGFIPLSWMSLSSLKLLDVSNNALKGTIPNFITTFPNLTLLSLRGNQISGSIPRYWNKADKLKVVDLSENRLGGQLPSFEGPHISLQNFLAYKNYLTGTIPSLFGEMSLLEELRLNQNSLTGEVPIKYKNQKNLEFVDVSINRLWGNMTDSCWIEGCAERNDSRQCALDKKLVVIADCTEEVICPCCADCFDSVGQSENNFCEQNPQYCQRMATIRDFK